MDSEWRKNYSLIKEYYENNLNTNIMSREKYKNVELGTWLCNQRQKYRTGHLSNEKIKLLEKLNIDWYITAHEIQIIRCINYCMEYYKENGNLNILNTYRTKDNYNLGLWFIKQKTLARKGTIEKEIKEQLDNIDKNWMNTIIPNNYPSSSAFTDIKWLKYYNIAKKYYESHNNIDLPYQFYIENLNIGQWLVTQRHNYKKGKLNNEKIILLENIGMHWENINSKDYKWNYMFLILSNYYKKYNHLYIPINFITRNGDKLGYWLYTQVMKQKNGTLSKEHEEKLDNLSSSWKDKIVTKTSFPEQAIMFYIKKVFKDAYKYKDNDISEIDIYIPNLKIGIEYDGYAWHKNVKKDIQKGIICKEKDIKLIRVREIKCPKINDGSYVINIKEENKNELEKAILGIFNYIKVIPPKINLEKDYFNIMDSYLKNIDIDWYIKYDELKEFYEKHGNLNVPASNKKLTKWIYEQRNAYLIKGKVKRFNQNKINLLNELNFAWTPQKKQWNKCYNLAEEYFKEHKNLLININYKKDGIPLGTWISTQRKNYKTHKLNKDQIDKLNKINMVWNPKDEIWNQYFIVVKEYYRENQNVDIPYNYVKNGLCIGRWIGTQRQQYKKGKLEQDRINKLNDLNINWIGIQAKFEKEWKQNYLLAQDYFEKNKNLNIPITYKVNGINLGVWVHNQKSKIKKNKLSKERKALLEELNI